MISTLNVRANHHNSCEDSLLVVENESSIDGIISDGCSTGINSHFASQAFCYAFQVAGRSGPFTEDYAVVAVKKRIRELVAHLGISSAHVLATCMLFHYNKLDKVLRIRVFGDGYYYVNGKEYEIDQNNTPDYLGYHLHDTYGEFGVYLNKCPEIYYENVDNFIICSDGIKSIQRSQFAEITGGPTPIVLFSNPQSTNYLARMWNLLKREHYTLSDDLSIISYDSNS